MPLSSTRVHVRVCVCVCMCVGVCMCFIQALPSAQRVCVCVRVRTCVEAAPPPSAETPNLFVEGGCYPLFVDCWLLIAVKQ
jgi:hypothetical protein